MAMKKTFEKLMSSSDEVESYLASENRGFRVYVPETIDVKETRVTSTSHGRSDPPQSPFSLDALSIGRLEDAPPEPVCTG